MFKTTSSRGILFCLLVPVILLGFSIPQSEEYDIDIRLNKSFTLKLPSNPSTGYRWYWEKDNTSLPVDSVGRTFIGEKPARVGAGGIDQWTFKGVRKGNGTLRFVYKRPGDQQPTRQEKVVRVRVK